MKMINLMREGKSRQLIDLLPDFTEQTMAETEAGCLTWLISALGFPDYEAVVHAYGTVIGTGNAIVGWDPRLAKV
jgi:2-aminophenol/2-amino-5-chlorophenol 1,6-dioxygenase beta subunit